MNRNVKLTDIKTFIVSFVLIIIVFIIVGDTMINVIENYYWTHMKEDSLRLTKSYSHSLTKTIEAYDVINGLLEEKILAASKVTALYDGHHSNELLKELAYNLKVDKIYSYNPKGEIIYSNTGEYIGWKAHNGHPVYDFMMSYSRSYVEDIRQDTDGGIYYKYGYFKAPNEYFVQIGVLADKIEGFIGAFEIQRLFEEMEKDKLVSHICFVDDKFTIVGSTDNKLIGRKIINEEAKTAIIENKEYGYIDKFYDENLYEVFVPIYYNNDKIGTLLMGHSFQDTKHLITKVSLIGIATLLIILGIVLYAMFSTHDKNKKLIKLAYYDILTGLPNKEYLNNFLMEELNKSKKNKKAIVLMNYNNFRNINLIFGFQYADKVFKEASNQLKNLCDSDKKLFRFSDDRFALYVNNYKDKEDLILLINKVQEKLNNSRYLSGINEYIDVEIGIVEIDERYTNVDQILKNASIALNYISDSDSINHAFFNEAMESKLKREDLIEKEIRNALSKDDTKTLYLEYQPQVSLITNQIISFEALIRLKTEELGIISPVEFIGIAEKRQLIVSLGNWILRMACKFIYDLNERGYDNIKVSVNISGIQLLQDDFTKTVMNIIEETGVNGSNLVLEITESVLLDSSEIVNHKLNKLRDLGIKIALDDFGTGYSSLSRLGELNIDCVKIDKSFINRIHIKESKNLITKEIISMSHKLGYTVVAEGVELEEHKQYLIKNNCDIMQGYLFSKPLSQENAVKMLNRI